jgi:hypothetical protein
VPKSLGISYANRGTNGASLGMLQAAIERHIPIEREADDFAGGIYQQCAYIVAGISPEVAPRRRLSIGSNEVRTATIDAPSIEQQCHGQTQEDAVLVSLY